MKHHESHTTPAGRDRIHSSGSTEKSPAWALDSSSLAPLFSSWPRLFCDKCVAICSLLPQRAKDFERRGLRSGLISPDITNEISRLGTCDVSLPSSVLIIAHTQPPHQSNGILERKSKASKAINSAAALFVCLSERQWRSQKSANPFFSERKRGHQSQKVEIPERWEACKTLLF